MFSKTGFKKISIGIGVAILIILSLTIYTGYRNNWVFSLFFDEQVIELEGEIETPDGNLVLKPREMQLYHYRLIILADYELNPDFDDLGLKLKRPPWLLLQQQDNITRENSKPLIMEGDLSSRANKNIAEDYFIYEYRYGNLSKGLDLDEDLTFYLYSADLTKRVQKEVAVTPGEQFEIDIPGIGTYKGELGESERSDEDTDKIVLKGETNTDQFEHGFTTQVQLFSKLGEADTDVESARMTYNDRNNLSDSKYKYVQEYEIENDEFWNGEIMVQIVEINVPLRPNGDSETPYMDINIGDKVSF